MGFVPDRSIVGYDVRDRPNNATLYAPRNMNELLPEEENRKDLLCE